MLTKQELEDILHLLGLDYEAEANQIYVFYVLPDGRVDNFSLSLKRGKRMSDDDIVGLMKREYPASREGTVLTVERPEHHSSGTDEWLDIADVCQRLHITSRTLRNWRKAGMLRQYCIGGKIYFRRTEVDSMISANVVSEQGKLDKKAWEEMKGK